MKVKDESRVEELLEALETLSTHYIQVGILGDGEKYSESGITVLGVATVHEFGTSTAPERSFLRAGFDDNKRDFERKAESLVDRVVNLDMPAMTMLDALGEYMVGVVQEYLTDLSEPPLSDATIKAKGSDNPLIDTGRLRQSITYEIKKV